MRRWTWFLAVIVLSSCVPMPRYTARGDRSSVKQIKDEKVKKDKDIRIISIEGNALIREIDSWLGTPYRFGAVEKGKGTDCSGFVGAIFKKVYGMDLPREANDMVALGTPVARGDLRQGDLVFFEKTYKGSIGASHVGIFIDGDRFAHASTTVGVTYSNLSEPYYSNHFLGCRRILK